MRIELEVARLQPGRTEAQACLIAGRGLVRVRRAFVLREAVIWQRLVHRLRPHQPGRKGGGPGPPPVAWRYVFRRLRFRRFELQVSFGLGDPAFTAVLFGAASSAAQTLAARLRRLPQFSPGRPRILFWPDFSRSGVRFKLYCIVEISLAHIIVGTLLFLRERWSKYWGERARWLSIQSRA